MKIGIITLYYGGNFGTYFQAVCLQKQIQKLGHECEIVSASIRGIQPWKYYLLLCFNRFVPKQLKRVLSKNLNFYTGYCTLEEDTKQLKKSRVCFSLKKLSKKYDGIILGSDEIWSTNCSEVRSQLVFWGKGAQCPIVSYGSSGINWKIPTIHSDLEFKKLFNQMLYLGVRDDTTYKMVKKYIKEDKVRRVVDPTILNPFYIQKENRLRKKHISIWSKFPYRYKRSNYRFCKKEKFMLILYGVVSFLV